MDPQLEAPLPTAPGPIAGMFDQANNVQIQGGKFNNAARDIINIVTYSNHDIVETLRAAIPTVLEEVQKIQSPTTVDGNTGTDSFSSGENPVPEGEPVVLEQTSSQSALIEIRSVADRYTRAMLKNLDGYPLYDPQPYSDLLDEYSLNGIRVGDVGIITKDGGFEFLFNICPSQNRPINPPELPSGFTLEEFEDSKVKRTEQFTPHTHLFQAPLRRTKDMFWRSRYQGLEAGGGILELPEGASQEDATSTFPFRRLASCNAVEWYKYTIGTRGKDILNGSLYLVTSCTKCVQWGIAVFDSSCAPEDSIRFVHNNRTFRNSNTKYSWTSSTSGTFTTKVAPSPSSGSNENLQNQCVFMDGFKIMLRQDVFDNLFHDLLHQPHVPVARDRFGPVPDSGQRRDAHQQRQIANQSILYSPFNLPPLHPSDFINSALLKQQPRAKVALTHDHDWCDLAKDILNNVKNLDLAKIAKSFSTSEIDKNGCISFEKVPDKSLVIAIDVGTTFSGVSYSLLEPGKEPWIQPVTRFSGQEVGQGNSKVPSIVCYSQDGTFIGAGSEVDPEINTSLSQMDGVRWVEWFKLGLPLPHLPAHERAEVEKLWSPPQPDENEGDDVIVDESLEKEKSVESIEGQETQRKDKHFIPFANDFKDPVQVFADFLRYLFNSSKEYIIETESNLDPSFSWNSIERNTHFVLTHPNGWKEEQQSHMRKAAVVAGLVASLSAAAERISFVTEGEANLYFCLEKNPNLQAEQSGLLVVDCGGGTIDLSAYSRADEGGFREIAPPGCLLQGSIFVTSRARAYFKRKFKDSKFGSDDYIEAMAKAFDKPSGVKCLFSDSTNPYYVNFGGLRDNDRQFGVSGGRFKVEGTQVAGFFEPAIRDMIAGINDQCDKAEENGYSIKSILLAGGFGSSPYLYTKLNDYFNPRNIGVLSIVIAQLNKAVADGAISYYTTRMLNHNHNE